MLGKNLPLHFINNVTYEQRNIKAAFLTGQEFHDGYTANIAHP